MEPRQDRPLVDFSDVPGRLQTTAGALAALAVLGCVVDGVLNGLTFALMGRWAGIFVVLTLAATAVITALHALGGAGRAEERGERLASPDVGIAPRRIRSAEAADPVEGEGREPTSPAEGSPSGGASSDAPAEPTDRRS